MKFHTTLSIVLSTVLVANCRAADRNLRKGNEEKSLAELHFEDGSNVKWVEVDEELLTDVAARDEDPEQVAFLAANEDDPVKEFKRLVKKSKTPNAKVPKDLEESWNKIKKNKENKKSKEEDSASVQDEDNADDSGRALASYHDTWWQENYCSNPPNHNSLVDCRCYTHLTSNTGWHDMRGAHIHTAVYNIDDSTNSIGYRMEKEKLRCFIWCWHDGWYLLRERPVPRGWIYSSYSYGNNALRRSKTYGASGKLYDYSAKACSDILVSVDKAVCRNPAWLNF